MCLRVNIPVESIPLGLGRESSAAPLMCFYLKGEDKSRTEIFNLVWFEPSYTGYPKIGINTQVVLKPGPCCWNWIKHGDIFDTPCKVQTVGIDFDFIIICTFSVPFLLNGSMDGVM